MITKLRHTVYKYSKKLGERFGFDLPYFVENGFWVSISQITSFLTSFVLSIILARYLSKEVFGQYQLLLSILSVLSIFSMPGLNTSIPRSVARGFEYSYVTGIKYSIKWSFLGSLSFFVLALFYHFRNESTYTVPLAIMGVFYLAMYGLNNWSSFYLGKEDFKKLSKKQVYQNLLSNLSVILSVIVFPDSLNALISAYIISNSLFNLYFHFDIVKKCKKGNAESETITYGKYMTLISLLVLLVNYFDKIIVGFTAIEILAYYAIALKVIEIIKQFIKSLLSLTFPKFAKSEVSLPFKYLLILFICGLIFSLILFFLIEFVIIGLYSEKYIDAVFVFKIIVWSIPFYLINSLIAVKIFARQQKKIILNITLISSISTILFSLSAYYITKSLLFFICFKIYFLQIINLLILLGSNGYSRRKIQN